MTLRKEKQRERLSPRNNRIREKFVALAKKGYRTDYIFTKLSTETGLSEVTVEKIVFRRIPYDVF